MKKLLVLLLLVAFASGQAWAAKSTKKKAAPEPVAAATDAGNEREPAGAALAVERKIVFSLPLNTYILRFNGITIVGRLCNSTLARSSQDVRFNNLVAPNVVDNTMEMYAGRWISMDTPIPFGLIRKIESLIPVVSELLSCTRAMEMIAHNMSARTFRSFKDMRKAIEDAEDKTLMENKTARVPPLDAFWYDASYSTFRYRFQDGDIITINPDSLVSVHRNGYLSYDSDTLNGARITVNTDTSGRVTVVGF